MTHGAEEQVEVGPTGGQQIKEYFPAALLERYGDSIEEAAAEAHRAVEGVIAGLEAMSAERLQEPVAPGKWTPLEVADHLHRVSLLYVAGLETARRGEEPERHEKGWVAADGALLANLDGAEPGANLTLEQVVADLRRSTQAVVEAATAAEAEGLGDRVAHVNPYFGELNALGTVRMAALHARHHRKRHLDALTGRE